MSVLNFNFLGDNKQLFTKSSLMVYTNLSGTMQYVGKTGNDKTFATGETLVEWRDLTTGTDVLFTAEIGKLDFAVTFNFMQVLDPNVIAAAWNMNVDVVSDPLNYVMTQGSEPPALPVATWRFVAKNKKGLLVTLEIPAGICFPSGDWKPDGKDFQNIPVTVKAMVDTTNPNTGSNLMKILVQKNPAS